MSPVGWLLVFLVLVVVVAGVVAARRREAPSPRPSAQEPNDLAALGLSEVRPRSASDESQVASERRDEARFEDVPPSRPKGPAAGRSPSCPRPVRRKTTADGPWARAAVRHLLRSLAAHVDGPVAVVRHDGDRFQVEARTDGGPSEPVRGNPLALGGPKALDASALGGLAALVGGDARAVPLGPYVVLLGGRGPADDGYLDLLATLVDAPRPGPEAREDEAADADEGERGVGPAPVPRATIIAEEQAAAHEAGRPLAFALVTLADAEERLTEGGPEAVASAEAALRDRLSDAPDVGRIEPFGDLLFGVFLPLEPAAVARWCDRLASGDPPLFIGAVAPADGDPTGIRDAAAEALHDAYDQRRARVVGVE